MPFFAFLSNLFCLFFLFLCYKVLALLITSSRETLLSSSVYSGDSDPMSSSMTASIMRRVEWQYYPTKPLSRDDPELQDENRKILDAIENALKQLNIERVQMHEKYKTKVQTLSNELKRLENDQINSLELLRCRERELLARKEMLLWKKTNEKMQIDIVCRQISAFQTQLDSKKRDFTEYVAKELQELEDCGKLDEIGINIDETTILNDDLLLQVANSLDLFASQFIKDTIGKNNEEIKKPEQDVAHKESILNASTNKISQVENNLLQIETQLENLNQQRLAEEFNDVELQQRKMSLKLELNNSTAHTDVQTDTDLSQSDTYKTCKTHHFTQSNCTVSSPTITEGCDNITPLSNCSVTSVDADDTTATTTTATTTQPDVQNSYSTLSSNSSVSLSRISANEAQLMNDSGVYLKSMRMGIVCERKRRNSDDETNSCSSCELGRNWDVPRLYCPMHALQRKIATQKALIMKNLEMNVNKAQLDEQIAQLQDLQRRYIELEQQLLLHAEQCCAAEHEIEALSQHTQQQHETNAQMKRICTT